MLGYIIQPAQMCVLSPFFFKCAFRDDCTFSPVYKEGPFWEFLNMISAKTDVFAEICLPFLDLLAVMHAPATNINECWPKVDRKSSRSISHLFVDIN